MKTILHKANTRGRSNHGWLQSNFSFSFAEYYNPERIRFGVLRVLNDDIIKGGKGFGMHPHENMEIISIPLSGKLEHRDSMGNSHIIKTGDIQVMSAGTGITHSEMNPDPQNDGNFLQIWIFPEEKNVSPRYDQKTFGEVEKNLLVKILSPEKDDGTVWIHQQSWFYLLDADQENKTVYKMQHEGNGVYAFVLSGKAEIAGETLGDRDAVGISDTNMFEISSHPGTRILLIEIPMRA